MQGPTVTVRMEEKGVAPVYALARLTLTRCLGLSSPGHRRAAVRPSPVPSMPPASTWSSVTLETARTLSDDLIRHRVDSVEP
jgi:hypothetical protein